MAVRKKNLKTRIYEIIKKEIMSAKIKPNDQLLETKLAERFSVSRTPVREAMGMLSMEGLIKPLPKNGYFVESVGYKDMLEAFHIRILLEKGAASLAAARISKEDIEELKGLCEYTDFEEIWDFNKKFHMIIARASENSRLIKYIDQSINDVKRVLMVDPFMNLLESDGEEEHFKIIEALSARDSQQAGLAMEEHLINTRKRIHEQLLTGGAKI